MWKNTSEKVYEKFMLNSQQLKNASVRKFCVTITVWEGEITHFTTGDTIKITSMKKPSIFNKEWVQAEVETSTQIEKM